MFVLPMFSSSICVASRLRDTETLLASPDSAGGAEKLGSTWLYCLGLALNRTVHHQVPGPPWLGYKILRQSDRQS